MSVQRQRHTKARRDRKRRRLAITPKQFIKCPKCGSLTLPHRVCPNCGHYKGKEVIDILKKSKKKKK